MGLIFISDIHATSSAPICRTDNFLEAQNNKLSFLVDFANKNNADILSAGDQTDRPRDFLSLWILFNHLSNLKTGFYGCLGQHDKYCRSDKPTSVYLLSKFNKIKILSDIPEKINGYNVYGCNFGDDPVIPKTENNILVVHDMITTRDLAIKNVVIKDAEEYSKKYPQYDYILCGDIHRKFLLKVNDNTILNSGPMLRDTADDYFLDYSPGFYYLNKHALEFIEFPHEKNVISKVHIRNKSKTNLNFSIETCQNKDIIVLLEEKIKKYRNQEKLKDIIFGG